MSNHYTADGSTKHFADFGADFGDPTVFVDYRQPTHQRTKRDQVLDDLQALLDLLRANPALPVEQYGHRINYSIRAENDVAGLAELAAIAEAAGVGITDVGGRPVQPGETHYYARVTVGTASYEGTYVTRERMAAHHAHMSYRDNVGSGADIVVDGEVVAPLGIEAGETDA